MTEGVYFSVREICHLYSISKSYVYKVACRDQWRRKRDGVKVLYLLDDISATLDER